MKFLFTFSFCMLAVAGFSQEFSEKNKVGIELGKPLFGILVNETEGFENHYFTTLEGAFTRRLTNKLYFRGVLGYAYFKKEFDFENYDNTSFTNEGVFIKPGLDLNFTEPSPFNFLVGISPFLIYYKEKGKGYFQGDYFEDHVSPYITETYFVGGVEMAIRWLLNFSSNISLEGSVRLSVPFLGNGAIFKHYYLPGIGYGLGVNSDSPPYGATGAELKLYYRFN